MSRNFHLPMMHNIILNAGMNLFIGPSESGKSHTLRSILMKSHKQFSDFFVITRIPSGVNAWNDFFKSIGRKVRVFMDIPEAFVEWLYNKQSERKTGTVCVIFDDVLGSITGDKQVNIKNNKSFDALAMNGRHARIVSCILVQTPVGLTPGQIENCKSVFVFNCGSSDMKEKHLIPKVLSACESQNPWLYNIGKSARNNHYHRVFGSLFVFPNGSLEQYECLYVVKEGEKRKLYRYKAT